MRGAGSFVVTLCLATLLGCVKSPYQLKQEAQQQQAQRLRPAELEHKNSAWRARRSMRVRLYVAGAADKQARVRGEFEERLARANQVLESALQVRLVLDDVRELPEPLRGNSDTNAALAALEQYDPGKEADFVVAIVSSSPVVTLSFHDLGVARMMQKYIVMRTMDDVAEIRALESYDTLDPVERSRLYQQRKRHKEASVLLHEIGHSLGAMHTRDPKDLMHPDYSHEMEGFSPADIELMGYGVSDRLAQEEARDQQAVARRIIEHLNRADPQLWIETDRQLYLAELEQVANPHAHGAATAAASNGSSPAPSAAEEDLSGLTVADRARYLGVDQAAAQQRPDEVRAGMAELAKAYPDSFAVQQKACQLGMQFGLFPGKLKGYCDRMLYLSLHPAAP